MRQMTTPHMATIGFDAMGKYTKTDTEETERKDIHLYIDAFDAALEIVSSDINA